MDRGAAIVFFTHKPYQDSFTIEVFSEGSEIWPFYEYVPGNDFIGVCDDKIIEEMIIDMNHLEESAADFMISNLKSNDYSKDDTSGEEYDINRRQIKEYFTA